MNRNSNKRAKPSEDVDINDLDITDEEYEAERNSLENKSVEEMCKMYFPKLSGLEKKMSKVVTVLHGHHEEIAELKHEVKSLKKEVSDLKMELQQQHRKTNENYLVVSGFDEKENETEQLLILSVKTLFQSKLNIQPNLDCAYRIGKKTDKPRLVKIHFALLGERNQVWKGRKSLGHPYYISEDLHPSTRALHSKLKKAHKEAIQNGKSSTLNLRTGEVKIDDVIHTFDNDLLVPKRQA